MTGARLFQVSEEDGLRDFHPRPAAAKREIGDVVAELFKRGVELRFMQSLWPLRDAVVASTLSYSAIRMRNAQPRTQA